jgi:hypothetical protein
LRRLEVTTILEVALASLFFDTWSLSCIVRNGIYYVMRNAQRHLFSTSFCGRTPTLVRCGRKYSLQYWIYTTQEIFYRWAHFSALLLVSRSF